MVLTDVAAGVITPATAEGIYGVVFGAIGADPRATAARREAVRRDRVRVTLDRREEDGARVRTIALSGPVATTLGLEPGDVVELVNTAGASLRAWVDAVVGSSTGDRRVWVSADALRMLGEVGPDVELRKIYSPRSR